MNTAVLHGFVETRDPFEKLEELQHYRYVWQCEPMGRERSKFAIQGPWRLTTAEAERDGRRRKTIAERVDVALRDVDKISSAK
jgi:hypothetical protein